MSEEELETTEDSDDSLEEDDTELTTDEDSDETEDEASEEDSEEDEAGGENEQDDSTKDDEALTTLQTEVENLKRDNAKMGYALRNASKDKKDKPGDDEPVFTDAQLINIMEEHSDDKGVTLQVLKQMVKQATSGIKEDTVNATETAQTKGNLDSFLFQNWPTLKQEDSPDRMKLEQAKDFMQLSDHPFGDFLAQAAAIMQSLPDMMKTERESGRQEALKVNAEAARKGKLKKNAPASKGKNKSGDSTLPDEVKKTAASIGLKGDRQLELYATILKNANKGALSAEV